MASKKKEFRNRQSQSTARLLGVALGTIILGFLIYELIEVGSLEALGLFKSILLFVWPVLIPILIWRYRIQKKQVKEPEDQAK